MKIALFTDSFLPMNNGIVTFLVDYSKKLADRGHKVYIVCPKYNHPYEFRYKNIEVKRISSIPAFFYDGFRFTLPFNRRLLDYLRKEKIDIIHFHTPLTVSLQGILIAKKLGIPLVGTYHTNISDPNYLKHIRVNINLTQKLSWRYSRFFYNKCDLITCPSKETSREVRFHNFKEPIKTISNGLDLNFFNPSKIFKKKRKTLIFVGRIAHEKNISYLLECFSLLIKKMPNVKLIIVGDGPQFFDVKNKVVQLGLKKNVTLTGNIQHEKFLKSSFLKSADVFVTASTTETQGISTLEAQASGLVVVGINKGGIKDIVKNNKTGFLLSYGDKKGFSEKILKLLSDDNLYNKMKKISLREVKKHDINNLIDVWEKEYLKLTKKMKC